jgi:hypothetical protein
VKAPDSPVGGKNVNTFPDELKVVHAGKLIMIIETDYDSGSVIVGRVYDAVLPAATV